MRKSNQASSSAPNAAPSASSSVLPSPGNLALREEFLDLLHRDLVGPFDGLDEEVDESRVTDRYLLGVLAPPDDVVQQEDDEEFAEGPSVRNSDDGEADPVPNRVGSMLPSSVGMSFVVAPGVDTLEVVGSWGRYERMDSETKETAAGNPAKIWKRFPCGGTVSVPIVTGPIAARAIDQNHDRVVVRGVVRDAPDGAKSVTLFFVNMQVVPPEAKSGERQPCWLFQTSFAVQAPGGGSVFQARPQGVVGADDDPQVQEERELDMAYRLTREFAVGHGTAVGWTSDPDDPMRASRLVTEAMPRHEVEQMAPRTAEDADAPELAHAEFRMNVLAEASDADLVSGLEPLVAGYEAWIDAQDARRQQASSHLGDCAVEAERVIERARAAARRIRAGLKLLRDDADVREAFRFANRAMWYQRTRSIHARLVRRQGRKEAPPFDTVDINRNRTWRPFQLAFILLNLVSTADLEHEDRGHPTKAIADLLWFPTGGGKTEAYLGLAAFAVAMRRLQGDLGGLDAHAGVAVLMRYTLRLLTLQQFQRASALVCAMEVIRRDAIAQGDRRWGAEHQPFAIGLWVGANSTPNWTRSSKMIVKQAKTRGGFEAVSGTSSPHQLPNCPWCGNKLGPNDYTVEEAPSGRARTMVHCGNPQCAFSERKAPEGLPIVTVDEEIYRRPPTILVATVDKFAQMPWNGLVRTLFGGVTGFCDRHGFQSPDHQDQCQTHPATKRSPKLPATSRRDCACLRPPDLIIQDELHLISGPLGSMVGLYETAIDDACTWSYVPPGGGDGTPPVRVRPKVVASTATVRNASAQVRQLFCRDLRVFPPPGLDASDNFFARNRDSTEKTPGRIYLGVCAPGRNLKLALIRAFTAELAAAQTLYQKYGSAADPYMTLVGYFNSLRELGGMRRLVDDDVRNRVRHYDQRGMSRRFIDRLEEMTSRVASIRIPGMLDQLEIEFDPDSKNKGPKPFDVLLATSMISVGVDIERLGLMTMGGQPKGTAEYIQASSRVGRRHPGVVVTVYNWARPRDLSHFETFHHYHACFYRHVESLSVTPFAERAIDRGLAALLVSGGRMTTTTLNPNTSAATIDRHIRDLSATKATIGRRADNLVGTSLGREILASLDNLLDHWRWTAGRPGMGTLEYKKDQSPGLLRQAGKGPWDKFTCLNSMRDVEATTALVLLDDGTTPIGGGS